MRVFILSSLAFVVIGGLVVLGIFSLDSSGGSPAIAESNARATLSAAEAARKSTQDAARVAEIEKEKIVAKATISAAEIASASTRSVEISQATATAAYKSTAASLGLRGTAIALAAVETKSALDIQATTTARGFEIREKELEIERGEMTNRLRAFFGYAVAVAAVVSILYVGFSLVRVRTFKKDSVLLAGKRIVDPALIHSAVIDLSQAAGVPSDNVAAKIKERAQIVEAIRSSSPGSRSGSASGLVSALASPVVEVVEAESVSEWIDDVETLLLDEGEK